MMTRKSLIYLHMLLFCLQGGGITIISTSPQLCELMFQLGKGRDLIATSDFSAFPPEAAKLPRIGPLFMPSIEVTLSLRPDWVLLDLQTLNPNYEQALHSHHKRELALGLFSVSDLLASAGRILNTIYQENDNQNLKRYAHCLEGLLQKPETHTVKHSFTFLAIVWMPPTVLFGQKTFLSDLFQRVGGTNLAPIGAYFPQVTDEWLIQQQIDVLFFLNDLSENKIHETIHRWWPGNPPELQSLNTSYFARATFTPLMHVGDLRVLKSKLKIRECLEN